jgi:hypothetical protein
MQRKATDRADPPKKKLKPSSGATPPAGDPAPKDPRSSSSSEARLNGLRRNPNHAPRAKAPWRRLYTYIYIYIYIKIYVYIYI